MQKEWAFQNCIEHYGKRSAKGVITCTECGHSWQGDSELGDVLLGTECPHCATKLEIVNTRKMVFKQSAYFSIVTRKENFQVLRFFLIKYYAKAGQKAHYFISEVVQRWIAPNGRYETIARIRPMSYYDDVWIFYSNLENGNDTMQFEIERNYNQIKADVKRIVVDELKRIAENPDLQHLIKKE